MTRALAGIAAVVAFATSMICSLCAAAPGTKAANYVDTLTNAIRWANADRLFDQLSRA